MPTLNELLAEYRHLVHEPDPARLQAVLAALAEAQPEERQWRTNLAEAERQLLAIQVAAARDAAAAGDLAAFEQARSAILAAHWHTPLPDALLPKLEERHAELLLAQARLDLGAALARFDEAPPDASHSWIASIVETVEALLRRHPQLSMPESHAEPLRVASDRVRREHQAASRAAKGQEAVDRLANALATPGLPIESLRELAAQVDRHDTTLPPELSAELQSRLAAADQQHRQRQMLRFILAALLLIAAIAGIAGVATKRHTQATLKTLADTVEPLTAERQFADADRALAAFATANPGLADHAVAAALRQKLDAARAEDEARAARFAAAVVALRTTLAAPEPVDTAALREQLEALRAKALEPDEELDLRELELSLSSREKARRAEVAGRFQAAYAKVPPVMARRPALVTQADDAALAEVAAVVAGLSALEADQADMPDYMVIQIAAAVRQLGDLTAEIQAVIKARETREFAYRELIVALEEGRLKGSELLRKIGAIEVRQDAKLVTPEVRRALGSAIMLGSWLPVGATPSTAELHTARERAQDMPLLAKDAALVDNAAQLLPITRKKVETFIANPLMSKLQQVTYRNIASTIQRTYYFDTSTRHTKDNAYTLYSEPRPEIDGTLRRRGTRVYDWEMAITSEPEELPHVSVMRLVTLNLDPALPGPFAYAARCLGLAADLPNRGGHPIVRTNLARVLVEQAMALMPWSSDELGLLNESPVQADALRVNWVDQPPVPAVQRLTAACEEWLDACKAADLPATTLVEPLRSARLLELALQRSYPVVGLVWSPPDELGSTPTLHLAPGVYPELWTLTYHDDTPQLMVMALWSEATKRYELYNEELLLPGMPLIAPSIPTPPADRRPAASWLDTQPVPLTWPRWWPTADAPTDAADADTKQAPALPE